MRYLLIFFALINVSCGNTSDESRIKCDNFSNAKIDDLTIKYCKPFADKGEIKYLQKLADVFIRQKDYKNAYDMFFPLAASGDSYSQYHVSLLYKHGRGVEKDSNKAAYYMRLADTKKDVASMTLVATYYFTGRIVEPDYKSAYELWEKAALLGDYGSQTLIAAFCIDGEYYLFNYVEGLAWLLVAQETRPLEGEALNKYNFALKQMSDKDIKTAHQRAEHLIELINFNA